MLQDKDIKKIQELKADFTPSRVSADDIFNRFKALKLSECFSEFNFFKRRGYDFKMVLAILVSMVVRCGQDGQLLPEQPHRRRILHGKGCVLSPEEQPLYMLENAYVASRASFSEGDVRR